MTTTSEKTGTLHRVWFPLRSNATYFEGPGPSLDVEARIKQAALLCEEVAFELGMLDVTVTENGMSSFWTPPNQLSEEVIRRHREATAPGGPVYVAIGPESEPGVPAAPAEMHTMMSGTLQQAFVAEYHLLLHESGLDNVSWTTWAVPPLEAIEYAKQVAQRQNQRELIGMRASPLPKLSENSFLDNQLKKDLNYDLALAGLMGVPAAIDDVRRPILMTKAAADEMSTSTRRTPGALALHALAPDYTALSWPDVIALHDDDAIGAFRATLVELEDAVAGRSEEEWGAAIRDLAFDESLGKANDRLPTMRGAIGDVAVDVAAGSIPLPLLAPATSLIKGVAKVQRAREERRQDWLAVLFAARGRRRR
jgi:hypothetical protein